MPEKLKIISLSIDHLSFSDALKTVMELGLSHTPSYICFANAHMTIEAYKDKSFRNDLDNATLVLPDGKSVAVAAKMIHGEKQERIAGMDFMPALLQEANKNGATVFFYGSTSKVLSTLHKKVQEDYPKINIGGLISPPFRQLSDEELQNDIESINLAQPNFVFVSLGCPKQEKWMAANFARINSVLLGVGGAFAVAAGLQKRSPLWMQRSGLEWLHRLMLEPRRMFKRYLYTNSYFVFLLMKKVITKKA